MDDIEDGAKCVPERLVAQGNEPTLWSTLCSGCWDLVCLCVCVCCCCLVERFGLLYPIFGCRLLPEQYLASTLDDDDHLFVYSFGNTVLVAYYIIAAAAGVSNFHFPLPSRLDKIELAPALPLRFPKERHSNWSCRTRQRQQQQQQGKCSILFALLIFH